MGLIDRLQLRDLLDALAPRRGDVVISMAADMNRSLIEREWVFPCLRSLTEHECTEKESPHVLPFAGHIFGRLKYDGSGSERRLSVQSVREHGRDSTFFYVLKDLYSGRIVGFENGLTLTDEDFATLRQLWNDLRDEVWRRREEICGQCDSTTQGAVGLGKAYRERWPYAFKVFTDAVNESGGAARMAYRSAAEYGTFIAKTDAGFLRWQKGCWMLEDEDAQWFELTSPPGG